MLRPPVVEAVRGRGDPRAYSRQRPEQVQGAIPYVDPEGRLLVRDIYHQVAWYQSQGLVDKGIDVPGMLDYSLLIEAK